MDKEKISKVVENVQASIIASDKKKTKEVIKEIKKAMPQHGGVVFENKNFVSGKMTVLRRSFKDIFEHAIEDENIREWLQNFSNKSMVGWKYAGWGKNRPYSIKDSRYNPNNPTVSKHDNDTHWFHYYTVSINKLTYWINVKKSKDLGEVIYTIESKKPENLIRKKPPKN
jgi:hypothetical protein